MGNTITLEDGQYRDIGGDTWRHIISQLPTNQILEMMRLSKWLFAQLQHELIWRVICERFTDYDRLEFMKASTKKTWKEICKIRKSSIFKSCEVLVGSQGTPESSVLFHLRGDGTCFMGRRELNYVSFPVLGSSKEHYMAEGKRFPGMLYEMKPMREFSDVFECKPAQKLSSLIPLTTAYAAKKEYAYAVKMLESNYFVNISAYSPTVLFLSRHGDVLETMFLPASEKQTHNYDNFDHPRRIIFAGAEGSRALHIKAMDFGNFAIMDHVELNNNGQQARTRRVYFWTIYRPATVGGAGEVNFEERRIECAPVHITQLDRFNITHIEEPPIGNVNRNNHVRMFYFSHAEKSEKFIDVPKDQIYQIMVSG